MSKHFSSRRAPARRLALPLGTQSRENVIIPQKRRLAGCIWPAVLFVWIALEALAPASTGLARASGTLRVRRRDVRGQSVTTVSNGLYRAELRPEAGAVVSSLLFGTGENPEMTAWAANAVPGLLEEAHTADLPFRLVEEQLGIEEVRLAFEGGRGDLLVRKSFRFYRVLPWFKVVLEFENRSQLPLGGAEGPRISALVLPAGGRADAPQYYCLERGLGPEAISSATVLQELGPLAADGEPLAWLAVTDPVSRRGVAFVFLDDAALEPRAERNREGAVVVSWRYRSWPGRSRLRTEMLVVPLEGFAAVSGLSPAFVGDTTVPPPQNGTLTASLKFMPLAAELRDVSVVTRAYGSDGVELEPCDTLLFERITPPAAAVGELLLPRQPRAAWLQHEVYAGGERIGQFLVPLAPGTRPPVHLKAALPRAEVTPLQDVGPAPPGADEQRRGFVFWQFQGDASRLPVEPLNLTLAAGEKETLFFGLTALRPLAGFKASVAASADEGARDLLPLHPAATYLWSVEEGPNGQARLVPMVERELAAQATVWIALTVDAGALDPGRYLAHLFLQGEDEPLEVPLVVSVSRRKLGAREGFALWMVDAGAGEDPMGAASVSRLAGYGVVSLSVPAGADMRRGDLLTLMGHARAEKMAMCGCHSPGAVWSPLERLAMAQPNLAGDAQKAGPHAAAATPPMPAEPLPTWLLWFGADDPQEAARLERMGLAPAIVVPGLAGLELDPRLKGVAARHWLVEDGCAAGEVPRLLQSGRILPDQCVWLYLDLRGMDWRRAAVALRSAFWAAAWQGLAGAAVRCERPAEQVDRQSVLWHILRDAREEAAAAALARQAGQVLSSAAFEEAEPDVRRTAALRRLEALMGEDDACMVAIEPQERAFRSVPRAAPGKNRPESPLTAFAAAKQHALGVIEDIEMLLPPPQQYENLYWRGMPLLDRQGLLWLIVAGGSDASHRAVTELQREIRTRTGRRVAIESGFPETEGLAPEDLPRLIWVMGADEDPEALPQELRRAAALCGGDGALAGVPWVVRMSAGPTVALVGGRTAAAALARSFMSEPSLYQRAAGVR